MSLWILVISVILISEQINAQPTAFGKGGGNDGVKMFFSFFRDERFKCLDEWCAIWGGSKWVHACVFHTDYHLSPHARAKMHPTPQIQSPPSRHPCHVGKQATMFSWSRYPTKGGWSPTIRGQRSETAEGFVMSVDKGGVHIRGSPSTSGRQNRSAGGTV